MYVLAPLLNFNSDARELRITDELIIRHPNDKEKQLLEQCTTFGALEDLGLGQWSFAVYSGLQPQKQSRKGRSVESDFLAELFGFCRSLRLFKDDEVGLGPQYRVQTRPWKCVCAGWSPENFVPWITLAPKNYFLTYDELSDLRALHERVRQYYSPTYGRIQTAIYRFNFSYELGLLHKVVDLVVGLEALYLADQQELMYKMALRASYLLGETVESRRDIYSILRKAYILRSRIVHGVDISRILKKDYETGKIDDIIRQTTNILRESINKFMNLLSVYSHNQLLETVLDDNVLAGGSVLGTPNPLIR